MEGSEWFDSPGESLFYSRSMVAPRGGLRATFEQGAWQAAALHVIDATPSGSVSEGGGWESDDLEGHMAAGSVLRIRRGVGQGGFVAAQYSDKTILGTPWANRLMGADSQLRLGDKTVAGLAAHGSLTSLADDEVLTGWYAQMSSRHESKHMLAEARVFGISPGFRAENGFVTYSDLIKAEGRAGPILLPKLKYLPWLYLAPIRAGIGWKTSGELRNVDIAPEAEMRLGPLGMATVGGVNSHEKYEGQWLKYWKSWFSWRASLSQWFGLQMSGWAGESPYYDGPNSLVGEGGSAFVGISLRPHRRISLDTTTGWGATQPRRRRVVQRHDPACSHGVLSQARVVGAGCLRPLDLL